MKNRIPIILPVFCLAAISLLLYSYFLYSPKSFQDVKITDWLSFIVNLALALLAFIGFLYAKDWKLTLTESKILDEIISLKYEVIEDVYSCYFKFLPSMLNFHSPEKFDIDFFDEVSSQEFFMAFNEVRTELDSARDSFSKIHASRDKIVFLGWDLLPNKLTALKTIDDELDELYLLRFELEKLINDFLSDKEIYFNSTANYPNIKHTKTLAKQHDVTSSINELFNTPHAHNKFKYIINQMMDLRNSSLKSINTLMSRNEKIHDLVEPIK